jgi:6-pyruvoyltetrahydropterin/6-carboxytetrahydropterin synthase
MFRIGKTVVFAAAHHLPQLPATHKCHNPHGHNYEVYVEVESEKLDENGFVLDYGAIKDIIMRFDHKDLNEELDFFPTAEQLAQYFYATFAEHGFTLPVVRVKETDDSFAEFRP